MKSTSFVSSQNQRLRHSVSWDGKVTLRPTDTAGLERLSSDGIEGPTGSRAIAPRMTSVGLSQGPQIPREDKSLREKSERSLLKCPNVSNLGFPKLSRGEQLFLISSVKKALLVREPTLHFISQLSSYRFDDKLFSDQLVLRGLCKFKSGDNIGCVSDFNNLLMFHPDHRTALIYRAIAVFRELFTADEVNLPFHEVVKLAFEYRSRVPEIKSDFFARTVRVCTRSELPDFESIESDLAQIISERPAYQLAHSSLTAYYFRMMFNDRKKYAPLALEASRIALAKDWQDQLAFSVMWWCTNGKGVDEFTGRLKDAKLSSGSKRSPLTGAKIYLNRVLSANMFKHDEVLERYLQT